MKRIGNKVSYIRKPLAKRSVAAVLAAAISLALTCASIGVSWYTGGNAPLWAAAVGFSGLLFGAAAVILGIFSLFEKEKNQILSKLGLTFAGIVLFLWAMVLASAL